MNPSKMPGPRRKARRDNTDFTEYAEGGMAGGKWIQKMGMKKGALHEELGVPTGEKIPAKKLTAAAKKPGVIGKRARLAQTLKKLGK